MSFFYPWKCRCCGAEFFRWDRELQPNGFFGATRTFFQRLWPWHRRNRFFHWVEDPYRARCGVVTRKG